MAGKVRCRRGVKMEIEGVMDGLQDIMQGIQRDEVLGYVLLTGFSLELFLFSQKYKNLYLLLKHTIWNVYNTNN